VNCFGLDDAAWALKLDVGLAWGLGIVWRKGKVDAEEKTVA
jgi:hypothetical protein